MLKQTTLEAQAAKLRTPELQTLAFEMALSVCDAVGVTSEAEGRFLGRLQAALSVPAGTAVAAQKGTEQLAAMPVETPFERAAARDPEDETPLPASADDAALDRQILNAAILNGALELLPQTLATVAIVPLQLRLVYGIGQAYGCRLDQAHLKFLAVAGAGMTSQVLEGHVRKLFGGFAKRALGKGAKGVAGTAAGAAISFATTYALGQAAKRYYGGGRTLAMTDVRNLFRSQLEGGRALFDRYQGEVQEKAKTTDVQSLLRLVR